MKLDLATRMRFVEGLSSLVRRLPRGSYAAYRLLLGSQGSNYRGDADIRAGMRDRQRVFYDRHLKAYVQVDLADWAQRAHYFCGQYFDKVVPLLVSSVLENGGTFLDIGANRGIHTLHACHVLRGRGQVYSFEPNPTTFQVLQSHLTMNLIRNCSAHRMGLGEEEGELALNLFTDDHSGTCSFVETAVVKEKCTVPVRRLDSVIDSAEIAKPVLVKIDTEGFEMKVLSGMARLLDEPSLIVLCEVTDAWLHKVGSSADTLFAFMSARGFGAYAPQTYFANPLRERLRLRPCSGPRSEWQYDVVFARENALPQSLTG